MKIVKMFLTLFILISITSPAQNYNWISTWDPGGTLDYHSSVIDADGNTYVGYYSWDESSQVNTLGIVKHSSQGSFVWNLIVGNTGYSGKMKLTISPNGQLYTWGNDIIYINELDGTFVKSFSAAYSNPQDIFVNESDEVFITFFGVQHDGGGQGFGAAKFNAAGLLVWDDVYREVIPNSGYLIDSDMDLEGNLYLAGIDNQKAVVIKAGSNGLEIWENQTPFGTINDMELGYDNSVFVAGRSSSTNMGSISRFNSDGTFSWTKNYFAPQGNGQYMKLLKSNSGVYVAGYQGVQGIGNVLLVKHFSTNGDLLMDYEQQDPYMVPAIGFYEASYGLELIYNGSLYVSSIYNTNNEFYYGLIRINSLGDLAGYSYNLGTNYGFSCLTFDAYLYGGSIVQTCIEPLANWSDQYQLKIISYPTSITSVEEEQVELNHSLSQNYPNPFNPTTSIKYSLEKQGHVKLSVYDILGREVETLVKTIQLAGTYEVSFDGADLTSGTYVYVLESGGKIVSKKMILLK